MDFKSDDEFKLIELDVDQNRFYRECLLELNDVLQKVVGTEESGSFVGLVANRLADFFISAYQQVNGRRHYSTKQLANMLVDLKRRIGGDFYIAEITGQKIVLRNNCCPFGKGVLGKTSLCNMTSGVFGKVVAQNNNYAAVAVDKAIAKGDKQCQITILLHPNDTTDRCYKEFFNVS